MRIRIYAVTERRAAALEARQAARDYADAWRAFRRTGARAGSPQDYAVWAASGYVDAADRAVMQYV